jgi:hypothetical protein
MKATAHPDGVHKNKETKFCFELAPIIASPKTAAALILSCDEELARRVILLYGFIA